MITDEKEMKGRVLELTEEIAKEKNAKRKAQLTLERSVFVNMLKGKTG